MLTDTSELNLSCCHLRFHFDSERRHTLKGPNGFRHVRAELVLGIGRLCPSLSLHIPYLLSISSIISHPHKNTAPAISPISLLDPSSYVPTDAASDLNGAARTQRQPAHQITTVRQELL